MNGCAAHTNWRHSLVVPGERSTIAPGRHLDDPGRPRARRIQLSPAAQPAALVARHRRARAGSHRGRRCISSRVGGRHASRSVAAFRSSGSITRIFRSWPGAGSDARCRNSSSGTCKLTYERCEQVLAPSRYMCEYLHGIGVRHAACQPLGVDVETFSPARRERAPARGTSLPRATRLLVFAGRFSGEKNIPVLIEAFRLLGDPLSLVTDRRRSDRRATAT